MVDDDATIGLRARLAAVLAGSGYEPTGEDLAVVGLVEPLLAERLQALATLPTADFPHEPVDPAVAPPR